MLAQGGCASISHWLGSFRTLIGQFWKCRENFVIFSHWLGSFEILPNQCVMLAHNYIFSLWKLSSASSLLLLRCNFHINSIFFISPWTYKNMQNVLKFPIWWWFHVTKKSPNYNLHWKHQTMLIFLDSSTLLPGYKRGDVMKSIVCIFFNTYIDILKKEEKKLGVQNVLKFPIWHQA